jgi:hypothetical protein
VSEHQEAKLEESSVKPVDEKEKKKADADKAVAHA